MYTYIHDIHNIYILILSRVWCHSHFLFFGRLISLMLARILTSHLLFHPLLIYSLLLQSSNFHMVSKWIWAPKWDVVICEIHSFFFLSFGSNPWRRCTCYRYSKLSFLDDFYDFTISDPGDHRLECLFLVFNRSKYWGYPLLTTHIPSGQT